MARDVVSQLSKISIGVVYILGWAWMYLRADQLFEVNASAMKEILLTYLIFASIIFSFVALARARASVNVFRISFLKAFPKFLVAGAITLGVLLLFQTTFQNNFSPVVFASVTGLGIGIILLHALFVATIEEKVFRGILPRLLMNAGQTRLFAWILSAVVFALFHYLLNGEWLTIIIYIPLGLAFQFVRQKFSPETDMANSGVHFAWNIWILGFLNAI